MGIISLCDGVASSVGVVNDFAVLKRLVAADEQGLLFANHVRVECSLIDESYEDVVWIMSTLRNSNVHYDFPLVSSFCVKDDSGWAAVELDMRLNGACDGYEWHVFSELPMDSTAFDEMRYALKEHRCLLLNSLQMAVPMPPPAEFMGVGAPMNLH
ncbi:hypothetical protein RYA05_05595 [Pseudomonas syringae pv. actinidiae]|nr:hypothetical protein [Pseudomonas syringae pv. actinidiae]